MSVKPTYDPSLEEYGQAVRGVSSKVGPKSIENGRGEVVDTILHEEMHQRLWDRQMFHDEKYIMDVTKRFTELKGLGIAPSQQ
jgi:hypothetical protein